MLNVTCFHLQIISWSRGVTVSTLDSESSDRGSNPRGTLVRPDRHTGAMSRGGSILSVFFLSAQQHRGYSPHPNRRPKEKHTPKQQHACPRRKSPHRRTETTGVSREQNFFEQVLQRFSRAAPAAKIPPPAPPRSFFLEFGGAAKEVAGLWMCASSRMG